MAEPVATNPGDGGTFTCVARQFDPALPGGVTPPCGATVICHGFWWCAQVCPACLACYFERPGTDRGLYLDAAVFERPDEVRAQIDAAGGRYIPRFA